MTPPSDLDRRAAEVVAHLETLSRRFMMRDKAPRDEVSLTRQEIRVIRALGARPSWTMGELANELVLAMSSLTGLVDRLVRKRLVERERSEEDRRTVRVRFTTEGRQRHAWFHGQHLLMARGMLGALDEREQRAFLELMRKIGEHASEGGKQRRARKKGQRATV